MSNIGIADRTAVETPCTARRERVVCVVYHQIQKWTTTQRSQNTDHPMTQALPHNLPPAASTLFYLLDFSEYPFYYAQILENWAAMMIITYESVCASRPLHIGGILWLFRGLSPLESPAD